MLIKVGNFEYMEVWDGVFYKTLSHTSVYYRLGSPHVA